MKLIQSKKIINYSIYIGLCLLCAWVFYLLHENERNKVQNMRKDALSELTVQQANAVRLGIEQAQSELKALSLNIHYEKGRSKVENVLNEIGSSSNFTDFSLLSSEGTVVASTGELQFIPDMSVFQPVLNGETMVLDSDDETVFAKTGIKMAAPVYENGQVVAILAAIYNQDKILPLVGSVLDGQGHVYLAKENGQVFLSAQSNKNQEKVSQLLSTKQSIAKGFRTNQKTSEPIELEEIDSKVFYQSVGLNDWNVLITMPNSWMSEKTNFISNNQLHFFLILLLGSLILFYQINRRNKRLELKLDEVSFVDYLTKGNNYAKFRLLAQDFLSNKKKDEKLIIVVLDIKSFRLINERYGHTEGDLILKLMYQAIQEIVEGKGIFGRGNIDRFFIMSPFRSEEKLLAIESQLKQRMQSLLAQASISYRVDIVAGVYVISQGENDVDNILEKANSALRYSKDKEEPHIILYDDEVTRQEIAKVQLEEELQFALENNEFQVYLQPKFHLQNNYMVGAEALCRWRKSDGKMVSPMQFIPVLEKNKKIVQLDLYMFESVCRILRDWLDQGLPVFPISINQSSILLFRSGYVETIQELVEKYHVPPQLISIELTETMVFEDIDKLKELVERLHGIGFYISIDDFGTGYSSLNLLKDIPVDTVKIDKSFVNNTGDRKHNLLLVGVVKLIKRLGMEALVEGVEKQEQIDYLMYAGADTCQGYIYDAPLPIEVFFEKYLKNRQREQISEEKELFCALT